MTTITPRMRELLATLAAKDRPWTQLDLTDATGILKATVDHLLQRLIGWGWVARSDDRPARFTLTKHGRLSVAAALELADPGARPRSRVWTVSELRAAVARGEQPAGLLAKVEQELGIGPQSVD